MSLFAAVATSAMAAPGTNDLMPDAQSAASQSGPSPDSPAQQPDENKQARRGEAAKGDEPNTLSVVEVVGVRAS
jgi:hypothetical protein